MKIFLAGGNQKNNIIKKQLNEMKVFLAGGESRHWLNYPLLEENENISCRASDGKQSLERRQEKALTRGGYPDDMNIYLAGVAPWRNEGIYDAPIKKHKPFILESYYYADEDTERLLPHFGDFLLDSGAFTFMTNNKKAVKWEEYIEKYADFINRNKVEKYFELDIDSVVGFDKVLEYRKRLEKLTNKQTIPVWHKSRGIDNFKRMCDEYKYVAIGGIVAKEIKPEHYSAFPMMINEAHKRGSKIHGLGFTSLEWLPKCPFDS